MLIKSFFEPDDDILLLNAQYIRSTKIDDKNWSQDILYLVYRDNKTKQKHVKTIKSPTVQTFITKPEFRSSFKTQRLFLGKDEVDPYIFQYNRIAKMIAAEIKKDGRDIEYLDVCAQAPKEAFKWRHSYFADYDIRDYAFISYILPRIEHTSDLNTSISAAFLDIESDVYGRTSSEMDEGLCPINAVSVVIPFDDKCNRLKSPRVFTFLLRNHSRYKDQEYFEKNLDKFIKECHDEFDEKYNHPKFIINIYDYETTLLRALFALLHKASPDFILIWNMQYDIPQIIKRLTYLGEDPASYFCHPDFETKNIYYNYDYKFKNDIKNSSDSFDCNSYSLWVDQMRNYAGIRKSKSDYGGNSLDNIANIELGAEKRKYSKKTVNVINGAIEEYWNFVKYSINDVLLQYGIDEKTDDLQVLFEQALYGGTRFSKALKQSIYLKNVFAIGYLSKDIVPKNNNNVDYMKYANEEDDVTIDSKDSYDSIELRGALVADVTLNGENGIKIFGEPSNCFFKFIGDYDFKAMYPNAKITANMSEHTQIARIIITDKIVDDENPDDDPKFMRGGKLIEDFTTDDSSYSSRWIGLKDVTSIIKEYAEWRDNDE